MPRRQHLSTNWNVLKQINRVLDLLQSQGLIAGLDRATNDLALKHMQDGALSVCQVQLLWLSLDEKKHLTLMVFRAKHYSLGWLVDDLTMFEVESSSASQSGESLVCRRMALTWSEGEYTVVHGDLSDEHWVLERAILLIALQWDPHGVSVSLKKLLLSRL